MKINGRSNIVTAMSHTIGPKKGNDLLHHNFTFRGKHRSEISKNKTECKIVYYMVGNIVQVILTSKTNKSCWEIRKCQA